MTRLSVSAELSTSAFGYAPCSSSSLAISKCPLATAEYSAWPRGAMPSSGRFGSAPRSSSSFTISRCPAAAALRSGGSGARVVGDVVRRRDWPATDPDRAAPARGPDRRCARRCRCRSTRRGRGGGRARRAGVSRMVLGHIAPAAKVVIAVGELDRARAIGAPGVDVRAAGQQFVDDVDLPRHHRPVDGLIGPRVAGVQQLGRGVEQAPHLAADRARGSPRRPARLGRRRRDASASFVSSSRSISA